MSNTLELEGEETTGGGSSSSSGPASTGSFGASGGRAETAGVETADTGSEPEGTGSEPEDTGSEPEDTGIAPECGNGIVEAGEACEGTDLAGGTCEGLGLGVGTLACDDACEHDTSGCTLLPRLGLSFSQVKRFDFSWDPVPGAEHYQLLESLGPGEPYEQLGEDIVGESVSFEMPLYLRWQASYLLRACDGGGCTDSAAVSVVGSLAEAVGYFKASNTEEDELFGASMALSADGNTLAVGAKWEDSSATGIGGNEADDGAHNAGAVYVFVRDGGTWSQQAYVKASNTGVNDRFGTSVALSGDGSTLAVSAGREDSSATGIGGNEADDGATDSGAVYVYVRDGAGIWSQAAYVKASNTGAEDGFGLAVALSGEGDTLAVSAGREDSSATGIGGDQASDGADGSGAVYVYVRDGAGTWSQQAYVKASNTGAGDWFGYSVALSGDGNTLAVGSFGEDSNATGIGGNQANDGATDSGAVYVFVRDGTGAWSQAAYVKASNPGWSDWFGYSVALSGDGDTLAVGSRWEDSDATGIGGNQAGFGAFDSGAAYVFVRDGAGAWSQEAYVKASNPGMMDDFGNSVTLSGDGNTLAVSAIGENSNATGIGGDQADDGAFGSGAVYVFVREGTWSQEAYVKAPNPAVGDNLGTVVALSGDGNTLAASAQWEDGNATGIGGNQANDGAGNSGAVYVY